MGTLGWAIRYNRMIIDFLRRNWQLKVKHHADPTFIKGLEWCEEIVEPAIKNFLENHDLKQFLDSIKDFDEWAFKLNYQPPQKSNWLNTGQNKAYPYITETIWSAIFAVICEKLNKATNSNEFKLIQGDNMPNFRCNTCGDSHKAVDTGIYIEKNGTKFPVIYAECKNGHACKTCHEGIWGQGIRLKQSFPNAIQMFVTDNNISIKDELPESYWNSGIDMEIQQRGLPGQKWKTKDVKEKGIHYELNHKTIAKTMNHILEGVAGRSVSHWTKQNVSSSEVSSFAGKIKSQGYYIKPGLFD